MRILYVPAKGMKRRQALTVVRGILGEEKSAETTDDMINPVKVWSEKSGKYVHGPAFWDAIASGEAIQLYNMNVLLFSKWTISKILQAGNKLRVIDTDGWDELFCKSGVERDYKISNKMMYGSLNPHLAREKAAYSFSLMTDEVFVDPDGELQEFIGFDEVSVPTETLPSWMASSAMKAVGYSYIDDEHVYINEDDQGNITSGIALAACKNVTFYRREYLPQHDYLVAELGASTLPDKAEYEELLAFFNELKTTIRHPRRWIRFHPEVVEKWERLGVLENYFRDESEDLLIYDGTYAADTDEKEEV